jgi:hypothetical protein
LLRCGQAAIAGTGLIQAIKMGDYHGHPFFCLKLLNCSPEKVFAQCNGLAIHAPVKSPDTGRTGSILIEVFEYVRVYEHEIYRNIFD